MIEHIEQGTLPHGCKAAIALTSWKKRITTVGLTIYNLFTMCGPEFHIVLTLAEEEFPKKERELPRDLVLIYQRGPHAPDRGMEGRQGQQGAEAPKEKATW